MLLFGVFLSFSPGEVFEVEAVPGGFNLLRSLLFTAVTRAERRLSILEQGYSTEMIRGPRLLKAESSGAGHPAVSD